LKSIAKSHHINNNNNNNYNNLYGAEMWPYHDKGALQATKLGKP